MNLRFAVDLMGRRLARVLYIGSNMKNGRIESVDLDTIETLAANGDYLAIANLVSGSYSRDLWRAAHAAHFGPAGTVQSWRNTDGTPSAECLAKCPRVADGIAAAKRDVTHHVMDARRCFRLGM